MSAPNPKDHPLLGLNEYLYIISVTLYTETIRYICDPNIMPGIIFFVPVHIHHNGVLNTKGHNS